MQLVKSALHALKNSSERILIICLVSAVLLTSVVSWGKLLTSSNNSVGLVNTGKSSQELKNKVVLFSGFMIVIAEYFQSDD